MALRIRRNGTIVCAAKSEAKQGDIYIDDHKHYELACSGNIKPIDEKTWIRAFPLK